MYKISVKTLKHGGLAVNKTTKETNAIEALTAIDSIIDDIEQRLDISFKKVIKLIKETRKNVTIIQPEEIEKKEE